MLDNGVADIITLRLAVGLLGESDNAGWWSSKFMSAQAVGFLSPIYGERTGPARYHGVVEAARRLHDERIGVGRVFHLFRLPEGLERRLHEAVLLQSEGDLVKALADGDAARTALKSLSPAAPEVNPGPINVGAPESLESIAWVALVAGHYQAAFSASVQTFPYFADRQ
ncbi:BrxE family protein [Iodidimonas sp. SYSU 1G8]|uniref:BrxE family protein n=1 Tax=Iodidimonas sp. SYSU 1G8 TaxID=3133967 RepID=UPI0031FF350F